MYIKALFMPVILSPISLTLPPNYSTVGITPAWEVPPAPPEPFLNVNASFSNTAIFSVS